MAYQEQAVSACLDRRFLVILEDDLRRIILSSPYTCAQFRIVLVHFSLTSKVAGGAFKRDRISRIRFSADSASGRWNSGFNRIGGINAF